MTIRKHTINAVRIELIRKRLHDSGTTLLKLRDETHRTISDEAFLQWFKTDSQGRHYISDSKLVPIEQYLGITSNEILAHLNSVFPSNDKPTNEQLQAIVTAVGITLPKLGQVA